MDMVQRCKQVRSLFGDQALWMIGGLASRLDCSVPSVRRFLSAAGYYSSFTHNGKWYTLHTVPRFDRRGLWFSDDVGFSRSGSLTNTLVHLVDASSAGMTADELGRTLRCRCHGMLVRLLRCGRLDREKFGRRHVYLATDDRIRSEQREALARSDATFAPLAAEVAVLVLAAFIRDPSASFEELVEELPRRHHVRVTPGRIRALFEEHGLKKTPRTSGPGRGAP